jgi:predicted dithiol-disulfide oxidoreductase (DUF899 family)
MNGQISNNLEKQIEALWKEISAKKQEFYALCKQMPRFAVQDYPLLSPDGEKLHLSDLFEDKDELILVHNMGKHCPYCTLWADGFNGVYQHLENRAAFVVSTPDAPEVMKAFADSRGWKFRMVSTQPTTLKKDLGFELENGHYMPGVSTFIKDADGTIRHVAKNFFGPGDDFCSVWYLFDMLVKSNEGWEPQFTY